MTFKFKKSWKLCWCDDDGFGTIAFQDWCNRKKTCRHCKINVNCINFGSSEGFPTIAIKNGTFLLLKREHDIC